MNEQQKRQLGREKTLLRYMAALEAGDLVQVGEILQNAEQDVVLERMILEVNDLYATEIEENAHAQDAAVVRQLIENHFLPPLNEEMVEPPPLTVGNVIARIHADAALRGKVEREALAATRAHQSADMPLPSDLSLRGVSRLLEQLGLRVGRRFQNLFRETAIFMRMGRNQGVARLAATRMQQQTRSKRHVASTPRRTAESEAGYHTPGTSSDKENDQTSSEAAGEGTGEEAT